MVDMMRFTVIHLLGNAPADIATCSGDTLFMPDYGMSRAYFPSGDARLLTLPPTAAEPS